VGRALYSLDQREKQGEYLSFEKDDIIVLSPVGATEGWWKGELVHTSSGQLKIGEKGLVPCSYIQTISFESVNDQKEYDLYSLLKVLNLFLLDSLFSHVILSKAILAPDMRFIAALCTTSHAIGEPAEIIAKDLVTIFEESSRTHILLKTVIDTEVTRTGRLCEGDVGVCVCASC